MNVKTLKGNGQFSNRDNLIIRSKKMPYPGWYESIYDDEGMWIETHFVWMHRVIAEEEILNRSLEKDEKVHHINMDKSEYKKENLQIFSNESNHQIAHGSYNKLCKPLMDAGIIGFNKQTGEYYLINQQ